MKIVVKDPNLGNFVWELPETYMSLLKVQAEAIGKQKLCDPNVFEKEEINDITVQVEQYLRILLSIFLSGGALMNERIGLKNLIECAAIEVRAKLSLESIKTNNP